MTHTIYHTKAIILGSSTSGEANKLLVLLTKDFGLITAHVRSIREATSKLRYSLQDFSYSRVDLVQGKSGWRVTSAEHIKNFAQFSEKTQYVTAFLITNRIFTLLRRLLKGEEKNELLFQDVVRGSSLLSSGVLPEEDALALEVVLVMRILNHLGYWGDDATLSPFLSGDIGSLEQIIHIKKQKPRAIGAINKALQETQL